VDGPSDKPLGYPPLRSGATQRVTLAVMNAATHSKIPHESKRLKQFRLSIAKGIPKFPNDKATLDVLEAKSIASLLVDYINWVSRLIPPRPRKVTIEPTLTADARWKTLSGDIKTFLEKVKRGDDVNSNLSLRASQNGFTRATSSAVPAKSRWDDKDFILNAMGYHHFHLSPIVEVAGHTKRTNEVLFAQVTKDNFFAIGIFDHSVFDSTDLTITTMSPERERLWRVFDQRNSACRVPGRIYLSSAIASSGHAIQHISLAREFAHVIRTVDPKLDNLSSRSEVFDDLPHAVVKAMKLSWHLNYLDLGLLDNTTSNFHVFRYGLL
jgi:hypothetical protein